MNDVHPAADSNPVPLPIASGTLAEAPMCLLNSPYYRGFMAGQSKGKQVNGANLGFEQTLWLAADKLRGHMDAVEYNLDLKGLLSSVQVVIPSGEILDQFKAFTDIVNAKLYSAESRILAALRDALLPKLLSGELRVKEAETSTDAVTT